MWLDRYQRDVSLAMGWAMGDAMWFRLRRETAASPSQSITFVNGSLHTVSSLFAHLIAAMNFARFIAFGHPPLLG